MSKYIILLIIISLLFIYFENYEIRHENIISLFNKPTGKENFIDCSACPPDCKSCNANQEGQILCNECNDGFYSENGVCHKCDSTCATCSSKNTCLSCINGYLFDGVSSCKTQCSSDCLTCESDPNKCTSCPSGFFSSGTKCLQCYEGCKTCENNEWKGALECTSCIDGYFLEFKEIGRQCTKCNQECRTCVDNQ